MTRLAPPAAAEAPSLAASDGAPDAASLAAELGAAADAAADGDEPPLEHAATMIATSASRTPNRLITWSLSSGYGLDRLLSGLLHRLLRAVCQPP
jgi:hypothetical protein